MKTKKIIPFFLLFIFVSQFGAITLVQSAETIEVNYWEDYKVLANQVKIDLATPLPSGMSYQVGAPSLERFTPLPSQKISENEILYRSEVVINFDFTLASVYNMASLNKGTDNFNVVWGRFFFCERFNRAYNYVFIGSSSTKSYSYDPGNKYWATSLRLQTKPVYMYEPSITVTNQKLNAHPNFGYEGDLNFDIQFDFDDSVRDFGDTQIQMTRKAFVTKLEQTKVISVSEYENTAISEYNEAISARVTPSGAGAGANAFEGKINEMNLGVTAGSTFYRTVIEGETVAAPRGSTLQNGVTLRGVKLYPNVLEKKQNVNVRYGSLDVDTQTEVIFGIQSDVAGVSHVYGAPTTSQRQRVLGWEIKNKGQLYSIQSTFILESLNTVEVIDNDVAVPLEPINQTRDVYYWDNYVEGVVEISPIETVQDYTPEFTSFLDFLSNYGWGIAIVIIVVAIVALTIYMKASNPMNYMPQPPPHQRYYDPRNDPRYDPSHRY